jgi:hypothetical protein
MTTQGGLGGLPATLRAPPVLIYQNNNDRSQGAGGGERPSVARMLREASPALPPETQWEVLKHGSGKGAKGGGAVMHAKLLLLRFGPGDDDDGGGGCPGFLRVCVASANLYAQWGHSRGACWRAWVRACRSDFCFSPHHFTSLHLA